MDIFNLITLAGGVAVFLYGMHIMGEGLQATASDNLERLLSRLTGTLPMAVLLGAAVTAIIQSSSGTTVMVVGLVNSGIMTLNQAVGVIMGANIGTTITAWILSLTGLQGDSFFLRLLNPSGFAPILAVIGVSYILFSKRDKRVSLGTVLFGFGLLMMGMEVMASAISPLQYSPNFQKLFVMFENPILGVLVGAVLTAIIQSSSASVGILQALAATGQVAWASAIPIIMGQNIGTCITALLSAIGAKKNAKRAAIIHLLFNAIGSLFFMLVFYAWHLIRPFSFLQDAVPMAGIALFHTIFNVAVTVMLLPFHNQLVKLSILVVHNDVQDSDDDQEDDFLKDERAQLLSTLDPRFLDTPGFALGQATKAINAMAELTNEGFSLACKMLHKPTEKRLAKVIRRENLIDSFEDELQTYLLHLSQRQLGDEDSIRLNIMMHSINDFERISDHTVHIAEAYLKQVHADSAFSAEAQGELDIIMNAVQEVLELTIYYFENRETNRGEEIEALEEVIDKLNLKLHDRHIQRLKANACTVEMGFVFSDILTALERISDHCANISFYINDVKEGSYDRHEYKMRIAQNSAEYKRYYQNFQNKYQLPELAIQAQRGGPYE